MLLIGEMCLLFNVYIFRKGEVLLSDSEINKILHLHKETGCSLFQCSEAIRYSSLNEDCTPLGFLKAKKSNFKLFNSFKELVKYYSKEDDI